MHSYLRAIGFSKLKNRREQNTLITSALKNNTDKMEIEISSGIRLVQINRNFGKNLGISIIGEYDNEEILSIDHFFHIALDTILPTRQIFKLNLTRTRKLIPQYRRIIILE